MGLWMTDLPLRPLIRRYIVESIRGFVRCVTSYLMLHQGTYKQQHDTGQNLKYVIVYPHVSCAATAAAAKESNSKDSTASHSRLDVNSPEYIVTACEKATLLEIVASKTTSWSQKKRLLKCLEEAHAAFKAIEEKLMTGAVLSATEQQIYDNNNGQDEAKIVWLTGECKSMIDNGQLTDAEKKEVLANLTSKLTALEEEIALTKAENKPKKLEKLLEKQTQQLSRKKMIEQIVPIVRRCRHSEQIQQFRMKLLALQAVEDKGRSCSLTLADLKMLEEKSALEDSLAAVERSSKGWFETEEEFNAMIQCDIRDAAAKYAAKVKANKNNSSKKGSSGQGNPPRKPTATSSSSSAGYSTSSSHVAGNNWSNIGVKKVVHNNTKKASAASGGGGGGGFAAAFDGGDSDSD